MKIKANVTLYCDKCLKMYEDVPVELHEYDLRAIILRDDTHLIFNCPKEHKCSVHVSDL
jgi:hypothetical protein